MLFRSQDAKLKIVMVSRIIKVTVVATVRKKKNIAGPPYGKGNRMHQNSKRLLGPKAPESWNVRLQRVIYVKKF